MSTVTESPFAAIPAPEAIRMRLSEITAESRVLHNLLAVAERKSREEKRLKQLREPKIEV